MPITSVKYDTLFSKNRMEADVKRLAPTDVGARKTKKIDNSSPWLQSGSNSPTIHSAESKAFMEAEKLPHDLYKRSKTAEGIVENNLEGIELAVDRRIALFFHHAILCHGMSNFKFSVKDAKDQEGTAPAKVVRSEKKKKSYTNQRQGAHPSTSPTLIAHARDGSTPNGIIFLKGGSSYALHQGVNGMDIRVNQCDTYLDGKQEDRRLRYVAMKILNKVAKENLSPIAATHEFMDQLITLSKKCSKHFKRSNDVNDKTKRLILKTYKVFAREAKAAFSVDDLFGKLASVAVDPEDPNHSILHEVAFRKRFALIQKTAIIECSIAKKIDRLRDKLPTNGKNILELILLKEFSSKNELQLLEKIFAKTAQVFDGSYFDTLWANLQRENAQIKKPTGAWNRATLSRCYKGFITSVENLRRRYRADIDRLIASLTKEFLEWKNSEIAYRADLLRTVRKDVRGMSQLSFAEEYSRVSGKRISRPTVTRMEHPAMPDSKKVYLTPLNQRCKIMTAQEAIHCAKVLKVDPGLFISQLG